MAASPQNGNGSNGNGVTAPPEATKLPKTWDGELVEQVLERIAEGETLRAICRDIEKIKASTFCAWVLNNIDGLTERYARARQIQMTIWSDRIAEVASTCRVGEIVTEGPKGREVKTVDMVDRSRLEVDTLKWLMSKLHPSQYGEHVAVTSQHTEVLDIRFTIRAEAEEEPGQNGDTAAGENRISAAVARN